MRHPAEAAQTFIAIRRMLQSLIRTTWSRTPWRGPRTPPRNARANPTPNQPSRTAPHRRRHTLTEDCQYRLPPRPRQSRSKLRIATPRILRHQCRLQAYGKTAPEQRRATTTPPPTTTTPPTTVGSPLPLLHCVQLPRTRRLPRARRLWRRRRRRLSARRCGRRRLGLGFCRRRGL